MAFKFVAVAGAIFTIALTSSLAQAQTPQSPPISAGRLRLARAVFEAQGGMANVSAAMDRVMASLQAARPGESAEAAANRAKTGEFMQQVLRKYLPKMLDSQAEAYAETFDERQLADILAFYQSPTGQVMRQKLPELAARNGTAISKFMPAVIMEALELQCGQSTCTPQQQTTLATLKQQAASKPAP
ncbi:MAG TPA: DUF2059 domain-containing protein [Caulobacteraceae bacterium]|nr:DUF2059 domain-containing protein [Caulobacteraceae bacterium]